MPTRWLLSLLTSLLVTWAIRRWGTLLLLGVGGFGMAANEIGPSLGDLGTRPAVAATNQQEQRNQRPQRSERAQLPRYFEGRVVRIVDGDTIDVVPNSNPQGRYHRIRLAGIDTPEKRGPTACPGMAAIASDVLEDQIRPHNYQVQVAIEKKIGQRWLGEVFTAEGVPMRALMLQSQTARIYFPGASKTPWQGCF